MLVKKQTMIKVLEYFALLSEKKSSKNVYIPVQYMFRMRGRTINVSGVGEG